VYYALRFMYGPGSRGILAPNLDFMSIALLALGVGSFLFHASLRHALEYVDELSMLGLTWSMLQASMTARQPPSKSRAITAGLAIFHIAFCFFYVWSASILSQVVVFVGSIIAVGMRAHYLFHWVKPGFPSEKRRNWAKRTRRAALIAFIGYIIWNVDLQYCAELRAIRQMVGLPWAWLFEFHGWWHILTGIGAGRVMQVAREVHAEAGRKKEQ